MSYRTESNVNSIVENNTNISKRVTWQNLLWVAKHGNDSNDGTSPERAKLTFGSALGIASSGTTVICLDDGNYEEDITVPNGVDIHAPNADFLGTMSFSGENNLIEFWSISQRSTGGFTIRFDSTTESLYQIRCKEFVINSSLNAGIFINCNNVNTRIVLEIEHCLITNSGKLVNQNSTTNNFKFNFDIQNTFFYGTSANGAIAMQFRSSNGVANGTFGDVYMANGNTTATLINLENSTVNIMANYVESSTLYTMGSGSIKIIGNSLSGTRTVTGGTATEIENGVFLRGIKSGATQVGAGASADEIWKTASHATLPDNVLLIGV